MSIVLVDTECRAIFYPLTFTRSLADLKWGFESLRKKWEKLTDEKVYVLTVPYLQPLYESIPNEMHYFITADCIPTKVSFQEIQKLEIDECILNDKSGLIATFTTLDNFTNSKNYKVATDLKSTQLRYFVHPMDFVKTNNECLQQDFVIHTHGKKSQPLGSSNFCSSPNDIFLEKNVKMEYVFLNTEFGPIYISENAEIMEGAMIKGPVYIGKNATVKMGAKIYSGVSIGENSVVGGEVKNSIIDDFSNKGHDGYLGDAYIGKWCNLGGGTTNSNVKNSAGAIQICHLHDEKMYNAGKKAGVIMGDYTRTAINTSINTGSIYGIASNIFGNGLLPKRISNFSWGVSSIRYEWNNAIRDINNWQAFKQNKLSEIEINILKHIYENEDNLCEKKS